MLGVLGELLVNSASTYPVILTLPVGLATATRGWHLTDGSSPAGAIIPCATSASNSSLTAVRHASGICVEYV